MKIVIATDFSRVPGVRFPEEGDYPGQDFREKVLLPKLKEAIKEGVKLEVILDGTAGLGTSFLEESFGGLIRIDKISYDDIVNTIILISKENPHYIDEINTYLDEANKKKNS
jgi:hypothetical protein